MAFEGAGYTPGGAVDFFLAANGRLGTFGTTATPEGSIAGLVRAPDPDDFLEEEELAGDVSVTANDRTRIEASAEPFESQFAPASLRLTRSLVSWRSATGRIVPHRSITFRAVGHTDTIDRALHVHYRLHGQTVRSVRLGILRGPCGDLTTRLRRAFPFRPVRAGSYALVFNASATDPTAQPRTVFNRIRVTQREAGR
jgi:hypothetical protein